MKNTFLLDTKYLSSAGVSEKWKKLNSTSKKTVFTVKNKVFLKKVASPKFKTFNGALNKQNGFYETENSFPLAGMKISLEKLFYWEKLFPMPRICDK